MNGLHPLVPWIALLISQLWLMLFVNTLKGREIIAFLTFLVWTVLALGLSGSLG